jgi:hypothetical protein
VSCEEAPGAAAHSSIRRGYAAVTQKSCMSCLLADSLMQQSSDRGFCLGPPYSLSAPGRLQSS